MKASTVAKKILKHYGNDPKKWNKHAQFVYHSGFQSNFLDTLYSKQDVASSCLLGTARLCGFKMKDLETFRSCFRNRSVVQYNDAPHRTFVQIVRRLKQIAPVTNDARESRRRNSSSAVDYQAYR